MTKVLSKTTKWLYGVADMGIALVASCVQFFLLIYYTDVARIDPRIAGTALMVGKLTWDAVNDPIFGYISDRTRSRFGRRRVFMLLGAVPLGLATWLMFSVPKGLTGAAAFFVVLATFLLFDTFHTMTSVPYYALTPELTHDYDERTSLTAIRMVFSVLGYILGAGITMVITNLIGSLFHWSVNASWSGMGAVFGIIVVASVWTTAFNVKEKPAEEVKPSKIPPISAVLLVFKNKIFIWLMSAFFISSFSFALLSTLVPYFIIYQLEMKDQVSLVMLVMLVAIGLFLFPIKMVADRINKGPAYALGLFIAAAAVIGAFFLPKGISPLIYLIAFVAGAGFSSQWVFPWSMLPDIIEYDEKVTGERREGIYYGVWAFIQKLTNALGVAVSGWALAGFGYVPDAPQTDHALLGIRLFFSLIPAVTILISLPILIWYPVTKKSHNKLVSELHTTKE